MPASETHLRRALSLWDLIFYGIILIQPTAPLPLFGVVGQQARGHIVTTLLAAMFAMLFTAISFGRMARIYPSAGSAFTYVGREIHPTVGFATGWAIALEYLLNPVICVIWCSKAAGNVLPQIPYAAWAVIFALLFTALNLRGIRATARTNEVLVAAMSIVILWFFAASIRFLSAAPAVDFVRPFYDRDAFSFASVSTGTSLAVLTFIGFDGISTLSEEAHNPRRNILLATVLTCVITGVVSMAEVYAGQLVWPDFTTYPDADTAFVHVAGRAGGTLLFHAVNATLLVATVGSGMGSQLAGARLLYGMGRDNVIPKNFFGALEPKRQVPRNNVIFAGVVALGGAYLITFQTGAELLNFGALLGFIGVNLAAFRRSWSHAEEQTAGNLVPPLLGFVICLVLWIRLRPPVLLAGLTWLAAGLVYAAIKTRGFRRPLSLSEPSAE